MREYSIEISRAQYWELEKISQGVFAPLSGFMTEDEFLSVVETMRLPDGSVFPLPVVLDITRDQAQRAASAEALTLSFEGTEVGAVFPECIFQWKKEPVAGKVFGTNDLNHPGVARLYRMGEYLVGGRVRLDHRATFDFSPYDLTPTETRAHFKENGWNTVVGFQTRNLPHRAHEYLLRLALEQADGLFIQPLVGPKKRGDFTPEAILTAYRTLIDRYLPANRILLGVLSTTMRYAGPREAVFHAIIRRNYGCTHFIVGRDHAGVGDYYSMYEAHELTRQFDGDLGIEILRLAGPFYCEECLGIATERTCPHWESAPQLVKQISGTEIRQILSDGSTAGPELIRPQVVDSVRGLPLFIDEDDE